MAPTTSSGINSPTIRQRKIRTTVVVNDGDALVLGGMIQESKSSGRSQIPIIGDIPFLGNAASSKDNAIGKTELIILIRPHVIRNLDDARTITDEYRRYMAVEGAYRRPRYANPRTDRAQDHRVMPTFRYRAYALDGGLAEGHHRRRVAGCGDRPAVVAGADAVPDAGGERSRHQMVEPRAVCRRRRASAELMAFTREFAMLSASEIPLDDALRILQAQASSPRLRSLVDALLADVLNGMPLSDAMQKQPRCFPPTMSPWCGPGRSAEPCPTCWSNWRSCLERRAEIRARVRSALIYPCILVALSLGTLAIIVGGLIPSIAPIFGQNGKPMPATIRIMLALRESWFELGIGAALAGLAMVAAASVANRRPEVRLTLDRCKLRLPLLGAFLLQTGNRALRAHPRHHAQGRRSADPGHDIGLQRDRQSPHRRRHEPGDRGHPSGHVAAPGLAPGDGAAGHHAADDFGRRGGRQARFAC